METIGQMILRLRKDKGEPIRVLASYLEIDQAVMSKIETGNRKPSRDQVVKLAKYFEYNEREMLIAWLSDKIVYEIGGDDLASEALKAAEQKVAYKKSPTLDEKEIIKRIKIFFEKDKRIEKAWIFGSFARGDQNLSSDIDIMIEEKKDVKFSYFDLADVQYQLEQKINRKVDIGFADSLKKHSEENIQREAILIYEKS